MSELALMVAIARNGAIGKGGDLPWSYPEDRAHFEQTTRGHVMIMGRRTFEEAGAPFGLPSIVVSRTLTLPTPPPPNVFRADDLDAALTLAWTMDPLPFVIGGVRLFEAAMPRVTRIYLSEIPESPEADTYFHLDRTGFVVTERKTFPDGLAFLTLERQRR
jgi:dihydrofolate reductase